VTGLFGGAFDPPHAGHVALARAALERLGLAELVVLVVADPGHRRVASSADVRLRLARAAFGDLPRTRVELDRHRFTVDLLRDGRFDDPIFLVGADQLAAFPTTWKEPAEVLRLARLGVATRPGVDDQAVEAALARLGQPDRVIRFEIPPVEVSGTDVRARAARGEPIDGLVPARVAALVSELRLYRGT
jgi:nicotinate-nucleotide adenylyltransferase